MDRRYSLDTQENRDWLSSNAQMLLDFGRRFPSPGGAAFRVCRMTLIMKRPEMILIMKL